MGGRLRGQCLSGRLVPGKIAGHSRLRARPRAKTGLPAGTHVPSKRCTRGDRRIGGPEIHSHRMNLRKGWCD